VVKVIKEVLEDFLSMTESHDEYTILGVDQKIGACHMKLERGHPKFRKIIREIPTLHLLKMKIINFCGAYKDSGLLHILKFMLDNDNKDDIVKILHMNNIRHAARIIQRIALAFCLSMQILYMQSMSADEEGDFITHLQCDDPSDLAACWDEKYSQFIETKSNENATFSLHIYGYDVTQLRDYWHQPC
jgi:hypothetical protein